MSCVSFVAPGQREALRRAAGADASGERLSRFASPPASEGSRRRVAALARDRRPPIRAAAAAHVHADEAVLTVLSADADPQVRQAVARNRHTPVPLLETLASDPDAVTRGWVAAHPATPDEVLDALAEDDSAQVRDVVAWARRWPSS